MIGSVKIREISLFDVSRKILRLLVKLDRILYYYSEINYDC